MHTFTPEAQQLFDRYLANVRWSVRGIDGGDDIEVNVRDHVDSALESEDDPVSSHTLRAVLARLGDPWEWVPADELPLWRRAMMRFSLGPEDWRLAYLCFGMTLIGLLMLPVGIGVFVLAAAYLLARATCELSAERGTNLGARRWLVYPPLIAAALMIAGACLIGPPSAATAWGVGDGGYSYLLHRQRLDLPHDVSMRFDVGAIALTFGVWWLLAAAIGALAIRPLRWALVPLGNTLRRVHFLWLAALGAIGCAVGGFLLA